MKKERSVGKVKTFSKLLLLQAKMRFKKAEEYEVPRCGISFNKMSKLAAEVDGIQPVEGQNTKGTTFKVKSKIPEAVFGFASQLPELIMGQNNSPSKKDQKKMLELNAFLMELEPKLKNIELYRDASTFLN